VRPAIRRVGPFLTLIVLGYSIQLPLFFILSLSMNLFVPTLVGEPAAASVLPIMCSCKLTAGRLWWVIRRIRGPNGAVTKRKGRNAMIIMYVPWTLFWSLQPNDFFFSLESGLIYSVFVSFHMGFFHFQNPVDTVRIQNSEHGYIV
jgi:hypothetical protein